jgi:glycosyltransferase involved in cell wall biosynthesis
MGGGEMALLNLLETLDRRQFSPMVLLFSEGPLAAKLRSSVETHVIPLDSAIANTRKDTLGAGRLLSFGILWQLVRFVLHISRFIRQQNIDLVHTNSLKSDIIGGVSARIAGKPVIWHVRDRISADYLPKPAVAAFRLLASFIPTHVIAVSQAVMHTLGRKETTGSARKATVVLDGIKLPVRPAHLTGEYPAIGLIGRISPWKGQHIFLRAAALVHELHPDARFRIIGAALFGEHEYEQGLHTLAAELRLQDAVEFTGFRSDIPECITRLDIVVHASTTGEPFGQVILEGMAAGKAVVATAGGGVPEIIENGINGLLVPMNDVPAMANAICSLLDNPERARDMGSKGRDRVERVFKIERVAQDVEGVFSHVLAST